MQDYHPTYGCFMEETPWQCAKESENELLKISKWQIPEVGALALHPFPK